MLDKIDASSINELFGDVPKDILLNRDLNIASGEAETSLLRRLNTVANKNVTKRNSCIFPRCWHL